MKAGADGRAVAMPVARTAFVLALTALALLVVPSAAADHEVVCVDDPVCYAQCQVERALLFADGAGDLPVCRYAQS